MSVEESGFGFKFYVLSFYTILHCNYAACIGHLEKLF